MGFNPSALPEGWHNLTNPYVLSLKKRMKEKKKYQNKCYFKKKVEEYVFYISPLT